MSSEREHHRQGVSWLPITAMTRATVLGALSTPVGALAACASLAAWPLCVAAAPLGIRDGNDVGSGWIYELAFMSGSAGVALGTAARKRLDPWIRLSAPRLPAGLDLGALGVCGLLFAGLAILPAILSGHASGLPVGRLLLLLAVSASWGVLAMRLAAGPESAGWATALGSFLVPVLWPAPQALARTTVAAAALLVGAWLADHPPGHPPVHRPRPPR